MIENSMSHTRNVKNHQRYFFIKNISVDIVIEAIHDFHIGMLLRKLFLPLGLTPNQNRTILILYLFFRFFGKNCNQRLMLDFL